jgi:aminopeptidase
MIEMKKTVIRQYARLIASVGAAVQKGQSVVINAEADQYEFVKVLVEECYRCGAAEVSADFAYQPLTRLNVRHQSAKTLGTVKGWEEARLRYRAETLPAMIYLESADPDGLDGINQQKWGKAMQSRYKVIKPIRDTMENKYQWCIAGVPGERWAKKMFPGESRSRAMEKLWEAILATSRADGPDPAQAWADHNADLKARCDYLNSLELRSLEYKAGNGTQLTVGLIPDSLFLGGAEAALGSGIIYNPNIPSEECFITPMKGQAEGIVYSSRPLSFRGLMIEDFSIRFEGGRAVEVHAAKNEDALRQIISMDDGAAMLGECALVPYDSPIRNCGLMFYSTLYDENAACHLALGMGFENSLKDYEKYTLAECREKGINDSMMHEDFMIGTADLSIVGVTARGERVQIFRDGNWAF